VPGHPYRHGFDPRLVPDKLLEPLRWPTAKTVFVNSMSDLFQDVVPDDYILAVATVMLRANWHTYQILTKRAERLQHLLNNKLHTAAAARHIWWGVSVEDKKYGIPRIHSLRDTAAAVRFLSIEPLLEDLGRVDLNGIDWVIVGGESGPGARPMNEEWVTNIKARSDAARAAFFFKQWGGVQKARNGRALNGRTYDDMPAQIALPIPSRAARQAIIRELQPLTELWTPGPLILLAHRQPILV
jgi:protein gp37